MLLYSPIHKAACSTFSPNAKEMVVASVQQGKVSLSIRIIMLADGSADSVVVVVQTAEASRRERLR